MKIGFVTPYSLETLGGVETFVKTMENELNEKGIKTETLHASPTIPKYFQLASSIDIARKANKLAKTCDVMHAQKWASFANKYHDKPSITTTHDTMYGWLNAVGEKLKTTHRLYRKNITYKLEKTGYENSDYVVALSNKNRMEVIKGYGIHSKKVKVIPNGVDTDFVKKPNVSRDAWKSQMGIEGPVLLWVGRADTATKGFDLLMEMCYELRKKMDFTLLIAGSIDRIKDFEQPNWMLVKKFDKEKMWQAYAVADVFVQTSRYEACSLVVIEALINKIPVVAFDAGAVSEQVSRGNGIIIDNYNTKEMAKAIEKAFSMKVKTSEKDIERFSSKRMVKEYIKIYDSLI